MLSHGEQKTTVQPKKSYLGDGFFDVLNHPQKLTDQTIRADVMAEIEPEMRQFHFTYHPVFGPNRPLNQVEQVIHHQTDDMTDIDAYQHHRYFDSITRTHKLVELLGLQKEQRLIINWAIMNTQDVLQELPALFDRRDFSFCTRSSEYLSRLIFFNTCHDIQDLFAEEIREIARHELKKMSRQLEKDMSSYQMTDIYRFILLLKPLQMHQDPALEKIMSDWVTHVILFTPDDYLNKIYLYLKLLTTFKMPLDDKECSAIVMMLERINFKNVRDSAFCAIADKLDDMKLLDNAEVLAFMLNHPIYPGGKFYQEYPHRLRQAWGRGPIEQTFDDYLNKIPKQIASLEDTLTKNSLKNPRGTHLSIFPILPVLPHNQGTFTSIKKALVDLKASLPILKKMQQAELISGDEHAVLLRIPGLLKDNEVRDYPYVRQNVSEHLRALK